MSFKILYVTATSAESDSLKNIGGITHSGEGYMLGKTFIMPLITGVGSVSTAWTLQKWLSVNEKPDLVINGGIAGSYIADIKTGDVVMPASDCFADSGIEEGSGFLTIFESGLAAENDFPYSSGILKCENKYTDILKDILKPVKAITVNTATGSDFSKNKLITKFNPDIETMEGATFFYICKREKVPFLAIRAISNLVEPRNRDNWDIRLALNNLSEKLKEVILTLE